MQLPAPAQLYLSRLLEWLLGEGVSQTILRLKGFAPVAELGGCGHLLQLSGCARWTLEESPQQAALGVQLVAIGKGMDEQAVMQQLQLLCEPQLPAPSSWQPPESAMLETCNSPQGDGAPLCLIVRFEPMRKFGKTPEDAKGMSGMNLDEANQMLIRAINMSAGHVVLAAGTGTDETGEQVVGMVLPLACNPEMLDAVWTILEEKSQWMLDTYFKALLQCACGW